MVHFIWPNPTQPIDWLTQPNPTQLKLKNFDSTQPNGTMEKCCSQGQNPKAKDEAKARTLKAKAETKAWTLQGQGRGLDPRDQDQARISRVQ